MPGSLAIIRAERFARSTSARMFHLVLRKDDAQCRPTTRSSLFRELCFPYLSVPVLHYEAIHEIGLETYGVG